MEETDEEVVDDIDASAGQWQSMSPVVDAVAEQVVSRVMRESMYAVADDMSTAAKMDVGEIPPSPTLRARVDMTTEQPQPQPMPPTEPSSSQTPIPAQDNCCVGVCE